MLSEYAVIQAASEYVSISRTQVTHPDPDAEKLALHRLRNAVDGWSFSSAAGVRERLLGVLLKHGPAHATGTEDLAWANDLLDALTTEAVA